MTKLRSDLSPVVQDEMNKLGDLSQRIDFKNPLIYGDWLAQTYYFVCHSTRLLALTSARFPLNENKQHYQFASHVGEERGHEILAINDLKSLSLSIEQFPEYSETKAFYQTQYYQIEHLGPMTFWGYVLCLEVFSVSGGVDIFNRAKSAFGDKGTSFLKIHVQEDEKHTETAFKHLENVSEDDLYLIKENLHLSCDLYRSIYHRIIQSSSSSTAAA